MTQRSYDCDQSILIVALNGQADPIRQECAHLGRMTGLPNGPLFVSKSLPETSSYPEQSEPERTPNQRQRTLLSGLLYPLANEIGIHAVFPRKSRDRNAGL
jgi:hypothetical protein